MFRRNLRAITRGYSVLQMSALLMARVLALCLRGVAGDHARLCGGGFSVRYLFKV